MGCLPFLMPMEGTMRTDLKLKPAHIEAIESVLAKDQRVMLIPTKDSFKIVKVKHEEVKVNN